MLRVTIKGIPGLSRALKQLQREARLAIKESTLAAAEPIVDEARRLAPRRDYASKIGHMADSIHSQVVKSNPTSCRLRIGPDRIHWYARFAETGTVHHAAQPFLRPALDTKHDEAVEIFAREMRRRLKLKHRMFR